MSDKNTERSNLIVTSLSKNNLIIESMAITSHYNCIYDYVNKKMQHRLLSHIFDRIIISVPKYNYFGKPIKYNFIRVH